MEKSTSIKPILGKRYQLQKSIGTGGMAVVYLARDLMLERQVAIKLLRQRFSRDAAFREKFHYEAQTAANLTHQNIVTVYDFGLDKNRLYIVMEYVPGTDLKTMMKERQRFPVKEAINLISQACFGIGYAHRAGLVHCDVKPHNMLVTPAQRLKVTDFGISRVMASIQPDEQHDVVWGSPLYFSPEQAAGEAPSPASDVYSLGVILYEILTGQAPFYSDDPVELAYMHREINPPRPSHINQNITIPLEQIILKVLSKKPSTRYRSADQLGRVLENLDSQVQKPPENNPMPRQPAFVPPARVQAPPPQERLQENNYPPTPAKDEQELLDFDWITIGLGLLAAVTVLGLIPFWMVVYLTLQQSGG